MGWDTYLTLGARTLQSWRKHAPAEARFLFTPDDLVVGDATVTGGEDDEPPSVKYVTTAGRAIKNLDAMGFTWQACVQAEEEIRGGGTGMSEGMLLGRLMVRRRRKGAKADAGLQAFAKPPTESEIRAINRRLEAFKLEGGEKDLRLLSRFLWDDLRDDEHSFSDPPYWARFLDVYQTVETPERGMIWSRIGPNGTRAFEALAWLKLVSPMLCWPMIMRIALSAAPKAEPLVLDVTGDADQHVGAGYATSPADYAQAFYRRSCDGISANAQLVGRFLSILSPTPDSPARGYWRGRAQNAMASLSKTASTTKEKGDRLEDLVGALIQMCHPDLAVAERNLRLADEELDVIVSNHVKDTFWTSLQSPLLFIECKNWSSPVGTSELRVFVEKVRERRSLCRVGFMIATMGFARSLRGLLRPRQAEGLTIFLLSMDDLRELVEGHLTFSEWVPKIGVGKLLKMS